ncbi:MAG: Ig-like domain repeat protein [Microbacteriaceae bacterium]
MPDGAESSVAGPLLSAASASHTVYVLFVQTTTSTDDDVNDETAAEAAVQDIADYWSAQSDGDVVVQYGSYATVSASTLNRVSSKTLEDLYDTDVDEFSCGNSSTITALLERATALTAHDTGLPYGGMDWFGRYAHLLVMPIESSTSCVDSSGAVGLGFVGSTDIQGGTFATLEANDEDYAPQVVDHEFGHNLGLAHANTLATGATECAQGTNEYLDTLDIMGYAYPDSVPNLSSSTRVALGLADATEVTASGSLSIAPLGGDSGTQLYSIEDPVTDTEYYLEYRVPSDWDAESPSLTGHSDGLVRLMGSYTASDGSDAPGSCRVDYGVAGSELLSPGEGFEVTVDSLDADGTAEVTVTFAGDCTADSAAVSLSATGSQVWGVGGGTLTATVASTGTLECTADGTVTFATDDGTTIGQSALDDGSASIGIPATALPVGSSNVVASYPDVGSSAVRTVTVTKLPTTVTATGSASGSALVVTVRHDGSLAVPGTLWLTVPDAGTTTAAATLADQGTVSLPLDLATGTHSVTVTFEPTDPGDVSGSTATTSVTVPAATTTTKAATKTSITVAKRVTKGSKLVIRVRGVSKPTGKVRLRVDGSTIKILTLTKAKNGKLVVKLPKLGKGKHRLVAVYYGSTTAKKSSSTTVKVRAR